MTRYYTYVKENHISELTLFPNYKAVFLAAALMNQISEVSLLEME